VPFELYHGLNGFDTDYRCPHERYSAGKSRERC
jgi:hypothetical protein